MICALSRAMVAVYVYIIGVTDVVRSVQDRAEEQQALEFGIER